MEMNTNSPLVIKNVDILTMADNKIRTNKTIVIQDGRISAIHDGAVDTGKFLNVIDGKGKTVMPGLINMHIHLGDNKDDLLLYLANGITAIRNMWGYEGFRLGPWLFGARVFNHLQLKKQIDEGKITGPAIFTAGPLLDGNPPFFPRPMYLHALENRKQIEQVIRDQAAKGYDFIKFYSGLSKQSFEDIVDVAKHYELPVAGHVPDAVGLRRVLALKVQSIEHLYGFFNPYHPESNIKKEDIKKLAGMAAAHHVSNCPTLIANERISNVKRQNEFENEKQMDYVSVRNKKAMRFLLKESNKLYEKQGIQGNHAYMEDLFYIVGQLQREGAGILMGTDKATPYVVAGFSEHLEMKLLSEAGLNNYEVLKAATINAAKCLKKEAEMGTVEIGKKANLILTGTNPLFDLKAVHSHFGVIKDGIYYSKEKCDEMLYKIKAACSNKKNAPT